MMTFDKGGIWKPVEAPWTDSKGKRIICENKDCSLHLNSFGSHNFGPFYSVDNSIGLIIATGNVGDYLSTRADEINTFLSRDGGLTWAEVNLILI